MRVSFGREQGLFALVHAGRWLRRFEDEPEALRCGGDGLRREQGGDVRRRRLFRQVPVGL